MSILLLLYGIETPEADAPAPVVPPVVAAHSPGGGVGGGIVGGVKSRKKYRLGEVLRTADYDYYIGLEDEDVMVILQ